MPLVALAPLVVAIGDALIAAWSYTSWDEHARSAMPRNRALAEALRAHEQARCWELAPEDPSLEACDLAQAFDAHFVEFNDLDVATDRLTAVAERALRCRCVSVTDDSQALAQIVALRGRGSEASIDLWRERQAILVTRRVSAAELHVLEPLLHDEAASRVDRHDVALAERWRAVITQVHTLLHAERAKSQRMAMAASQDAMSRTLWALGASRLDAHDRAAQALEVSRALDVWQADETRTLTELAILNELDRGSLRASLESFDARLREDDAMLAAMIARDQSEE